MTVAKRTESTICPYLFLAPIVILLITVLIYIWIFRCVICMVEFMVGDAVRYLPCMHTYHVECIDDWLMRSFTCPSCMEPVESALLSTYEAN